MYPNHTPVLPSSPHLGESIPNKMYKSLVYYAYPENVGDTVFKRIAKLFVPYEVERSSLDITGAFAVLKSTRKHDAMRCLKTWVNSWATSHRFHEAVRLSCLFGCDGAKDSMNHYVMCPILFALQVQLRSDTPACPLKRIGLIAPSRESILCIACTFAGYHAVKRNSKFLQISSTTLTLDQRFACHKLFAEAFWAEAIDNGFRCRHFVPSVETSTALSWQHEASADLGSSVGSHVQPRDIPDPSELHPHFVWGGRLESTTCSVVADT